MNIIKCIPRLYKGETVLFFPEYNVNPGKIMSWVIIGQHGEADIDFYYATKPCKNIKEETDIIRIYETHYECKLDIKRNR